MNNANKDKVFDPLYKTSSRITDQMNPKMNKMAVKTFPNDPSALRISVHQLS